MLLDIRPHLSVIYQHLIIQIVNIAFNKILPVLRGKKQPLIGEDLQQAVQRCLGDSVNFQIQLAELLTNLLVLGIRRFKLRTGRGDKSEAT